MRLLLDRTCLDVSTRGLARMSFQRNITMGTKTVTQYWEAVQQHWFSHKLVYSEEEVVDHILATVVPELQTALYQYLSSRQSDTAVTVDELFRVAYRWELLIQTQRQNVPKRNVVAAVVNTHRPFNCRACQTNAHHFLDCKQGCVNCGQKTHTGNNCPMPCPSCGKKGGHYYKGKACRMWKESTPAPVVSAPIDLVITCATTAAQQLAIRKVTVCGKPMLLGYDTLSCINIITLPFAQALGWKSNTSTPQTTSSVELFGVGGKAMTVGQLTLPVQLVAGVVDHITFFVVPSLPAGIDALVGWMHLQSRDIQINPRTSSIKLYGTVDTTTPCTPGLGRHPA